MNDDVIIFIEGIVYVPDIYMTEVHIFFSTHNES